MNKLYLSSIFFTVLICFGTSAQDKYIASWESIDSRPIPEWYTDAKFGIFIHWGLYSVPAWGALPKDGASVYDCYAEWYWWRLKGEQSKIADLFNGFHNNMYGEKTTYQDFAEGFRCEMFDPQQWAKLFKESGAAYVVLTSKHHEGFTMWPSEQSSNWNSVDIGPHQDLVGKLTEAVRNEGLRMGFYYSLYEWFNPLYKNDVDKYVDQHMLPQMKDLVTRYKPDIVWTDGEWDYTSDRWKSTQFLAWLYNESPVKESVVVNDRWGKETRGHHGGFYTTEYGLVQEDVADNSTISHPWEECRGIGHSFGFNRNENLSDYQTSEQLIHLLIEKVAAGGNLLLNIGPTADGRIPIIMQQRLTDMGQWLKVNGQAIYGTHKVGGIYNKNKNTYFTAKNNDLYVIVNQWSDEPIYISGANRPSNVSMLGYGKKIKYSSDADGVVIFPPAINPANNPCEYAWVFKIENGIKR